MKKAIALEFVDRRVEELFEKVTELVYGHADETKLSLAAIIGVLEMVKLDLFYDSNIDY